MALREDIQKLAGLKRSSRNLERIQEQLAELEELAGSIQSAEEAATTAREALHGLSDAIEDLPDDNPLIEWVKDIREGLDNFLALLPEGDLSLSELVDEAQEAASEYEAAKDDPDYTREDREEAWDALVNAMDSIAMEL